MMAPDVLSAVLDRARTGPSRPAVEDSDRALDYGSLVDEVARCAAGLTRQGVHRGDRVALHLPNSADFVVAALAALWAGVTFVPLAVTDPEARLAGIIADCAPAMVITNGADERRTVPGGGTSGPPWVQLTDLAATGDGVEAPGPRADADRVAYAIYTSGTTGTPKGVQIGNGAFVAAVRSTAQALDLDSGTRALCVSPFHFDGSFATLFPTLFVGGSLVIRPRESLLFPRTFFNTVLREAITLTGFSPSYLKLLLASGQMDKLRGSTLRRLAVGGEASSAADIEALWEAVPGLRVFNRYGPTETTIAVTNVELTPELLGPGTVPIGRPHPGVTFHLVDEDGTLIDGAGRAGELYIGGAQLMTGYWGAPELTAEVMVRDVVPGTLVYRTGDLVHRDGHGNYVYVDRVDRVVKRHGVRISLLELSDVVQALDGASAAASVLFDDDGDVGIATFVVTDGSVSTLEIRTQARAHLPDTMIPDRIELVDELPLTRSGKLDERRLLGDLGLSPPRPAGGAATPLSA